MLASAALIFHYRSGLNFMLDDWSFVIGRENGNAGDFLDPHNEHISVIPIAIFKVFLAIFGMGSPWPMHVFSVALFMLLVGVLFFYLKPLSGEPLALLGCAVILFLGSAWEDLLWIFQLGFSISLASGLGALMMLRRQDRTGDRLACLLLVVCILATSLGIPFMAGAAVDLLLRREGFRKFLSRVWIVAVPAAIYAIWWLGWGHTAPSAVSVDNAVGAPEYVFEAFRLNVGVLTGAFDINGDTGLTIMRLLAVVLIAFTGGWLYRKRRLPKPLLVAAAVALAFWGLAALNQIPGRGFSASRYMLPGAVFVLMMLAGALDGYRVRLRYVGAVAAVSVVAIVTNIQAMSSGYDIFFKPLSDKGTAAVTALEIARLGDEPETYVGVNFDDSALIDSRRYYDAEAKYGSPAWDSEDIEAATDKARQKIDRTLIGALPITGTVETGKGSTGACKVTVATPKGSESLPLPGAGRRFAVRPRNDVFIAMQRYGDEGVLTLLTAPAGRTTLMSVPRDNSSRPWRVGFSGTGRVLLCKVRKAS